jgi:hypothetical protein
MMTTTAHDHSQSAFLTQHKDIGDQQTNTHISIIYMMKYKYNIIVICIYIYIYIYKGWVAKFGERKRVENILYYHACLIKQTTTKSGCR